MWFKDVTNFSGKCFHLEDFAMKSRFFIAGLAVLFVLMSVVDLSDIARLPVTLPFVLG